VLRAALGEREVYDRGGDKRLTADERMRARRQAMSVAARATLIALVAAIIAWVV